MTRDLLLGVAILACALRWASGRKNPGRLQHLEPWQKLVGVAAAIAALLIIITPELFALGLLGDTAFFDLLVLLISLQVQSAAVQARWRLAGLLSKAMWWVMTPRMSYLFVLSVWAVVGYVVSRIGRIVHRITDQASGRK